MPLDLSPARWIIFANSLLLVALALYVATRKPRRRVNTYFAFWCASVGLTPSVQWIIPIRDPGYTPVGIASTILFLVAAASHLALILVAPRPLRRGERKLVLVPLLIVGTAAAIHMPQLVGALFHPPAAMDGAWPAADRVRLLAQVLYLYVAWFSVLLLAVRAAAAPDDPARGRYALFGAILVLWPAFLGGMLRVNRFFPPDITWTYVSLAFALAAWALWMRSTTHGVATRAARNAGLVGLAAYAVGSLYAFFNEASVLRVDFFWAVPGILEAVLLSYAVLHEQVLGIDLRLKWTVSRGTLAAVFLGVIFIVTEGASQLVGDRTQSTLIGLLAGGALVFALAPLQRFADRVADAAMPGVRDNEGYRRVRKRDVYRAALEGALVDGRVSDRERDVLARLQDQLGLSATDARTIERSVSESGATAP